MEGLPLLDRVEVRPSASLNWVFFSEGVCTFEMSHGLQEGWHRNTGGSHRRLP